MIYPKVSSIKHLQKILDDEMSPDLLEEFKTNPGKTLKEMTVIPNEDDYNNQSFVTVQEMKHALRSNPHLLDLMNVNPLHFIEKTLKEPLPPQYKIYRLLVGSLCAVLLLIIAGALAGWFIKNSKTPPDSLIAMASAIIGILVGMFIHVPGKEANTKD